MSPLMIRIGLSAAGIALCAGIGYGVVSTYRGAIQKAQEAEKSVSDLKMALAERDVDIAALKERSEFWKTERETASKALEIKEAERTAQAALYAKSVKEFNDAIARLEGEDLVCAGRPVPAAVDRLLTGESSPLHTGR